MTPEEVKERDAAQKEHVAAQKEHVAAQKEQFGALEAEVERLAGTHPTQVLLVMLRALIEMVCAAQGPYLTLYYKTKFYEGVILMLRAKGIS